MAKWIVGLGCCVFSIVTISGNVKQEMATKNGWHRYATVK